VGIKSRLLRPLSHVRRSCAANTPVRSHPNARQHAENRTVVIGWQSAPIRLLAAADHNVSPWESAPRPPLRSETSPGRWWCPLPLARYTHTPNTLHFEALVAPLDVPDRYQLCRSQVYIRRLPITSTE